MNLIRQETDYALRLMGELGGAAGESISAKLAAAKAEVPYEFACKILQKLHEGGLVASVMGPRGGFKLARAASEITLLDVVSAVQGPMIVNNCVGTQACCGREDICPISIKMSELQAHVDQFFNGITLEDVLNGKAKEVSDAK
ncbi:MAG: hypothetical protein A2Y07_00585 [Planctomycetes bacterium GWF2_50_10]|nr:MAG: hypothetical protein A2Y07_00585 [Planctomycetes bacterium GWF2_50_10]